MPLTCLLSRLPAFPSPACLPAANLQATFKGCCCEACIDAPRLLRPAKPAGLYGNWSDYSDDSSGALACLLPASRGMPACLPPCMVDNPT